ncbi:MAG TPA: hypothetical protein DEB40_05900 [Elusimicrobia bacterium]|nr:hypothetical protein [Elusimicrobiota bacterium]HBT61259.1 hypothetical protein [Elusimicrobiota bacterium]
MIAIFLLLPLTASAQNEAGSGPPDTLRRLDNLEQRLSKIEGAPAKTSISAFNPALGLALDLAYAHGPNDKSGFLFRAAELNVEAPIDPFLKGWAIFTGSSGGVDAEEAALQTTALPFNLKVTGGRMFASFGRLAHFHDHELPVTDRPRSLDTFIGGETQADGIEVSYLFPADAYVNATVGAYNKMGADNLRADNAAARPLEEFTYLGRVNAYNDIGDNHSVELGVNSAWTPKRSVLDAAGAVLTRKNTWRTLNGLDFTYRYQPVQGGLYRGVVWGTEVMQNNEQRFDSATRLPVDRVRAYSGYSYIWVKMGARWRPGALVDLTEDLDYARRLTKTYSVFMTYDVSEFQRLRAVYSHRADNIPGSRGADIVSLQWTGILGRHVHGFRDR